VELLGADKALNSTENANDFATLRRISGRGHGFSVLPFDLHSGMILISVLGMILKKTLVSLVIGASALLPMSSAHGAPKPVIVAGVSEWGALARQLVGSDATVISLLTDPNADPHEHEATVQDAEHVSEASVVLVNGAGYDTWLSQLIKTSNPNVQQVNAATLMNVKTGSNPHIFYNPLAAIKFVKKLTSILKSRKGFANIGERSTMLLGQLNAIAASVATIKSSCSNVKVAATEDVASYLLGDAGLDIVTPEALRLAVGNSVDPSVQDLAIALSQLKKHPAFLIDNIQTKTPLTQEIVAQATKSHVPIIKVTETMTGTNYVHFINGVVGKVKVDLKREGCLS
jgi:zinc/manganese transport system substrate-binding protein